MRQRTLIRSVAALVAVAGTLVVSSCSPASGLPTRQIALDSYCTLEVRVEQGDKAIVAVRKFGVLWVDKELTGTSESQGCGTWIVMGLDIETSEGTNRCDFSALGHTIGSGPGEGCTAYAPDWYQIAEPGELVTAHVGLCRSAGAWECDYTYSGGGLSVYP